MPQVRGIVITNSYKLVLFTYWIVSWISSEDNKDVSLSLVTLDDKIKTVLYCNVKFIKYKDWSVYFPKSFTLFF